MSFARLTVCIALVAGACAAWLFTRGADRSAQPASHAPGPDRPAGQSPRPDADHPRAPVAGVSLTVAVPQSQKAGHAVPVEVKLHNRSAGPVTVSWDTAEPFRVAVVLTDPGGKTVPLTRLGKRVTGVVEPGEPILSRDGSIRSVRLHPGRAEDVSIDNLALYYDLTVAGEYVLVMSAWIGPDEEGIGTGEVESSPVRFRVRP